VSLDLDLGTNSSTLFVPEFTRSGHGNNTMNGSGLDS